jgi:uncharacterized protein (DUF849 family)
MTTLLKFSGETMSAQQTVMITCAATGSTLSPSMSPHLPVTPEEIATQSIEAAKAGAAIIHVHARDPKDGRPTNDPEVWRQFIPRIRENCDAIINMSASMGNTAEDRVDAVLKLRPDIATVIVGSMNYGRFKKAIDQGVTTFKYDWEKEFYGPASHAIVTQNTFAKIDRMIDILIDNDIAMEFECYDVGHLYILDHHLQKKKLKGPLIVQFLTGILGGIPSDIDHLLHLKRTSERLFGDDVVLFTHGTGPHNMRAAAYGGLIGTNIRVGQEDNVTERPGRLFKSNAEQIEKIKRILDEFDIGVMTATEARQRLGLARLNS